MSTENNEHNGIIIDDDAQLDAIVAREIESAKGGEPATGESTEVSSEDKTEVNAEEDKSSKEEQEDKTDKANQEPDAKQTSDDDTKPADTPTFDATKYLEVSSGGKLKTEDDLKAALTQLEEIESIRSENAKLKEEKETIFANEYVKRLNQMVKDGKTQEQIDEFTRLSNIGDISKLEPKEILVQGLIDQGIKRSIAERTIEKKYGLSDFADIENLTDEEKQDLEVIQAQMTIDAKKVAEELSGKLEGIKNPINTEEKAIIEEAQKQSYRERLEPFAALLQSEFPKKMEYEANGQKLSYDVPEEVISSIKEEAIEYFFDKTTNRETVAEFIEAKKWALFASNGKKIISDIAAQHDAIGYKRAKDEYENRTGLTTENAAPLVGGAEEAASLAMQEANEY